MRTCLLIAAVPLLLTACALPGKPLPPPGRTHCLVDAIGVRCSDTPQLPDTTIIRQE